MADLDLQGIGAVLHIIRAASLVRGRCCLVIHIHLQKGIAEHNVTNFVQEIEVLTQGPLEYIFSSKHDLKKVEEKFQLLTAGKL